MTIWDIIISNIFIAGSGDGLLLNAMAPANQESPCPMAPGLYDASARDWRPTTTSCLGLQQKQVHTINENGGRRLKVLLYNVFVDSIPELD